MGMETRWSHRPSASAARAPPTSASDAWSLPEFDNGSACRRSRLGRGGHAVGCSRGAAAVPPRAFARNVGGQEQDHRLRGLRERGWVLAAKRFKRCSQTQFKSHNVSVWRVPVLMHVSRIVDAVHGLLRRPSRLPPG